MNDRNLTRTAAALALALTISGHVRAQQTAAPATGTPPPTNATPTATEEEDEGEMIVLTPFEVTASTEGTYTEVYRRWFPGHGRRLTTLREVERV